MLVTSPEILIFLFFMISDPVTIPRGRIARLVYAIGIGALAIPGLGPVLAGGVLATAFGIAGGTAVAGAGIGAAAGGIVGGLVGLGFPETEARHFEAGIRSGRVLVIVKAGERSKEAVEILERQGADTAGLAA